MLIALPETSNFLVIDSIKTSTGMLLSPSHSRSLALYLIYKQFLSKIERCLIKNTFINQSDESKRPGIAGVRQLYQIDCC